MSHEKTYMVVDRKDSMQQNIVGGRYNIGVYIWGYCEINVLHVVKTQCLRVQ